MTSTLTAKSGKLLTPRETQLRIEKQPSWFLEKFLGFGRWTDPEQELTQGKRYYWELQENIVESVRDHDRTAVIGCTGSTKTYAAAMAMCWWLSAYEVGRVFTIAPTFRQVENNIWGYVSTLVRDALIPIGGRLLQTDWKISEDCYAQGFSVKQPESVAGIHGKKDLIILDDTQGIPQPIIDAMERAMAGGTCHVLILANPMVLSGEVYDAFHKNRQMYNCIVVPADKTPNYRVETLWELNQAKSKTPLPKPQMPLPGAIVKSQCDKWVKKFGADSNFVRVMVHSLFPKQEADTLIPLDWLNSAISREIPPNLLDSHILLGVDVAWQGNDRSIISPIRGLELLKQEEFNKFDPYELYLEVKKKLIALNARCAYVDMIGIGSGTVADLMHDKETENKVVGVNVAIKDHPCLFEEIELNGIKTIKRRYANLRSYIWWKAREALDPRNPLAIKIPNDLELIAEWSCVKYSTPNGVITVEPKDDMRARLTFSPDKADGANLAIYGASLRDQAQESVPMTTADCGVGLDDDEDFDA